MNYKETETMPHRILYFMNAMKTLFYEISNALVFLFYVFFDSVLVNTSLVIKILGALVFCIYFLNQIRWRVIKPHYDGSWVKWIKDWFGLKGKNGR